MVSNATTFEEALTNFIEDFRDEREEVKYEQALSGMASRYQKSITVDFTDLYSFDEQLAAELLRSPNEILDAFSTVIYSKLSFRNPEYVSSIRKTNVRIRNLPVNVPLRRIGAAHVGRLIMLKGIVVKAASVRPFTTKALFKCNICKEEILVAQKGQLLKKPKQCPSCNRRSGFELVSEKSVFVDSQRLVIQEKPEDLPSGQLPRSMDILLMDDIVDMARPGDRVSITGMLKLKTRMGRGGTLRSFDLEIEVNSIEVMTRDMELLEITEEDIEEIREIASDPWVLRRMLQSIAPSLYGLDTIKEAVMYLLFGGVTKELEDVRLRGDINVLLVGDPGTGKSQLLMYASKAAPRGLYTTGRGSTAAGLTAAVVREGGSESFVLEAGALVLADKGICCIDEMDKMRDEDRGAIHPAMEQQVVSIAKGGIVATLNARTSILAAANPPLGRYNPHQQIAENLGNFPVTLLSRFDLIFVLRDLPEPEKDLKLAEHIIGLHKAGGTPVATPIGIEMLRKYIGYARRIDPVVTDEVEAIFTEFYVKMRSASYKGDEASAISITARQLESLVRLSEARARVHLREEVTREDAEAAIALYSRSLEQVGIDVTTGETDIDIIYMGKPRSLQMQLQKVLGIIGEMERVSGAVQDEDLFDELQGNHGIARIEASRLIGVLQRDGTIYSPRPGYYKRTM